MALLKDRERTARGEAFLEGGPPTVEAPHAAGASLTLDLSPEPQGWAPHWTGVGRGEAPPAEPTDLPYPDPAEPESPSALTEAALPGTGCDPSDPRFETEEDPRIPEGDVFRIGEVARIVGVKPHVLRFWETEFDWIVPEKTEANQRRYRRGHVAELLQIRRLRHDAQLTVAQTRSCIQAARGTGVVPTLTLTPNLNPTLNGAGTQPPTGAVDAASMERLRAHLADMRTAVVELLKVVEET